MLFSYLNLPAIPSNLEDLCLKNIDLIDNNRELNKLNKLEGIGHSITYIPVELKDWLFKNIIDPNFNPIPLEMVNKTMLHVSHYIKHQEGTGVHPTHIDYGRNYAINYIIDSGGDDVVTYWTDESRNSVIKEVKIQSKRWHVLKVNPNWHGVRGIKIGRLRTIVSLCLSPPDLAHFDANAYFKHILDD